MGWPICQPVATHRFIMAGGFADPSVRAAAAFPRQFGFALYARLGMVTANPMQLTAKRQVRTPALLLLRLAGCESASCRKHTTSGRRLTIAPIFRPRVPRCRAWMPAAWAGRKIEKAAHRQSHARCVRFFRHGWPDCGSPLVGPCQAKEGVKRLATSYLTHGWS